MKRFERQAAQGDLLIIRRESVKINDAAPVHSQIVAHSETGHHHVVVIDPPGRLEFSPGEDPLTSFLRVIGIPARLEHRRPFDTHETIELLPGDYELRRQREWAPEGWRRVED